MKHLPFVNWILWVVVFSTLPTAVVGRLLPDVNPTMWVVACLLWGFYVGYYQSPRIKKFFGVDKEDAR